MLKIPERLSEALNWRRTIQ